MRALMKFNFQENDIRSSLINNEPWFVGKDIAIVLGYSNTNDALSKHVDDEDKMMGSQNATPYIIDSKGRKQYPTFINESGLYALIFGSKLPRAKEFKHWVTSVVLPEIRKTGSFNNNVDEKYIEALVSISNSISVMVENTSKMCAIVMNQSMEANYQNSQTEERQDIQEVINCKLDSFPAEIKKEVNFMLNKMVKKKAMNFSMVSRFCTMNGYPISQPAVKRYYLMHFKK
ncbi:MAG: Bro-N domain-containing protein [[Clostridium] innocuum]